MLASSRAVIFLDQVLDLLDRGDDDLDVLAEGEAEVLGDLRVERIGEADGDGIAARRRWAARRGAARGRPG